MRSDKRETSVLMIGICGVYCSEVGTCHELLRRATRLWYRLLRVRMSALNPAPLVTGARTTPVRYLTAPTSRLWLTFFHPPPCSLLPPPPHPQTPIFCAYGFNRCTRFSSSPCSWRQSCILSSPRWTTSCSWPYPERRTQRLKAAVAEPEDGMREMTGKDN